MIYWINAAIQTNYCPTGPYEGFFFISSVSTGPYATFSFTSSLPAPTSSYTGIGWGPSDGRRCCCPLLFPLLPLIQQKMMSVASRAPAEKETRKMAIERATTVSAVRPTVAGSGSVEMSGSGVVGCWSVSVCRHTLWYTRLVNINCISYIIRGQHYILMQAWPSFLLWKKA